MTDSAGQMKIDQIFAVENFNQPEKIDWLKQEASHYLKKMEVSQGDMLAERSGPVLSPANLEQFFRHKERSEKVCQILQYLLTFLAQGAEAIAGGNYDIRMKSESRDESGELANVFNKMSDSLKIQRDEIRELQQFFEKIVEYSPSAIVIGNESAEVIAMNPAAEKLLEKPLHELKDKQFFECLPLFKPLKEDYFKVLLSGNPCFYDNFSVLPADGGEKVLRLILYKIPLPAAPAEVLQMEDISEKFELEEKLLHAKKLGTLGELLSRFTHEFNNLMTSLLGHLSMLKKESAKATPISSASC